MDHCIVSWTRGRLQDIMHILGCGHARVFFRGKDPYFTAFYLFTPTEGTPICMVEWGLAFAGHSWFL